MMVDNFLSSGEIIAHSLTGEYLKKNGIYFKQRCLHYEEYQIMIKRCNKC